MDNLLFLMVLNIVKLKNIINLKMRILFILDVKIIENMKGIEKIWEDFVIQK